MRHLTVYRAGGARTLLACAAAALALAGCGDDGTSPEPGGVTVGEARALDEAAEMLDERRRPDEALQHDAAGESGAPGEG